MIFTLLAAGLVRFATGPAQADVVLSSEAFEGESAWFTMTTDPNATDYKLPGTWNHANTYVAPHRASTGGAAAGTDPSGQHAMTRSTTGNMVLTNPLPLASGGYVSVTIDFAILIDFVDGSNALFLDYSANGSFSDTQVVKTFISTVNGSGTPLEAGRWYAGQSLTLDPETYAFTDTANLRWRSGGWANSTHIYLDDIVITGIGGTVAGTVLICR